MPAHSADRVPVSHCRGSSARTGRRTRTCHARVAGPSTAGNGDDLTTTAARNSPATADDEDDVTGEVPSVSGVHTYGYDSAGSLTLR